MQCLVQYCPCLQFVLHQTLLLTLLYLFKRCLGYGINLSFVTNSSSFAVWYRKLQNYTSFHLGTGGLKRHMVSFFLFASYVERMAVACMLLRDSDVESAAVACMLLRDRDVESVAVACYWESSDVESVAVACMLLRDQWCRAYGCGMHVTERPVM